MWARSTRALGCRAHGCEAQRWLAPAAAGPGRPDARSEVSMAKILMKTPLVEMDGDEMTRVLWQQIKDTLILPFVY